MQRTKSSQFRQQRFVGNGVNGAVTNVAVYDRSLGYDEVPTSGLAETVKKITAEKR